jgi:integrase
VRDDLAPFFAFAKASGMRLNECLSLRWPEVDWGTKRINKAGKGDRRVTLPITSEIRTILWQLRGHHPEMVFTYEAQRTHKGKVRGHRFPLTREGIKTAWRRLRKNAEVSGFRFHDYRHNFGTKLLRKTGNLKLVQRALNHADIATTTRYAHVLDTEVAEAMEGVTESRRKSRSLVPKAS